MQLEGRVAVITGGGRGIGRAIAGLFYAEGARVAIVSRNAKTLQTAAMEINRGDHRIVPFRCDVTSADEVEVMIGNVIEVWERIDILVNNAGVNAPTPVVPGADAPGDVAAPGWREILDTNLTGAWTCIREAVPRMPVDGRSRVINVSSVLGKFGASGYAAYCASKHGMIGLTRALALELAPRRITVNALCPGWVDTSMARGSFEAGARRDGVSVEEYRRRAQAGVPLGRFVDPEEVARLALYLASDAAAAMTGQAINLDGGAAMW
jgi:3-hydroxybutyrate dehydrogenase